MIDLAIAYHYKGRVNHCKGDFARAIPDFTMAIKLDSSQGANADPKQVADHWNFCGQCYYELGQYEDALRHYESAIKKDNQKGDYYYNRALVKSKLDKLDDAIADYVKAIEFLTDPTYIYQARFNKGVCLRRMGRLDESIEDLKQAVALKNDQDSAHNNLGLSYFEKEEYDDALQEFTKAIALKPHPFHFNNRGLALYHIHRYEEAKRDYDEAIKRNPDDAHVFFNRGNVFLNNKEFREALEDFDSAIAKEPKNPKFWHAKGLAFDQMAMLDPKHVDHSMQE